MDIYTHRIIAWATSVPVTIVEVKTPKAAERRRSQFARAIARGLVFDWFGPMVLGEPHLDAQSESIATRVTVERIEL